MNRSAPEGRRTLEARSPILGLNTFVQAEGTTHGIGKLTDLQDDKAEVEYFDSPVGPRLHRIMVPRASLKKVELSPQTRVFSFDSEQLVWRVGRVDGGFVSAQALHTTEDHYHVRFPNNVDARVPVSKLYVRWSHPIEDPTDFLAGRVTDTPFFFDGRSEIVRYLTAQRAAFGGLTGLASSAIDLLEHQVSTVRRILADPVERYLLADEVGLGKTIEAGILIRQHVIDFPHIAHVLVLVPRHLVEQWKTELANKFFLPTTPRLRIIAADELGHADSTLEDITMLVIDEAHRPALLAFHPDPAERKIYDCLRGLAAQVPRVLLLSGTPVLHFEEGFLAMLHLLDPHAYPLNDKERFIRRVRERQSIAEATADLSDDASPLFIEDALDKLAAFVSGDLRLAELSDTVRRHISQQIEDDRRIQALRALRTHLTETYRLHRRLLRTRRSDPRVQIHLPRRAGAIRIDHEDRARLESADFLDAWRLRLPDDVPPERRDLHERLFALWVDSAFSHPRVLLRHIDARLALHRGQTEVSLSISRINRTLLGSAWAFDDEESLLNDRRKLIDDVLNEEPRLDRFIDWLTTNPEIRKLVLFIDDCEVADIVTEILSRRIPSCWVYRYDGTASRVNSFERSAGVSILVCDGTTEEGLNLQRSGAAVAHYDLPLEPARIEQRIGRIDRIEARGRMRIIVFSPGCSYETEWLTLLTEAVHVFERSVAPLQYVLIEATARIRSSLAREGRAAIEQETVRMRDPKTGLDAELRRIRAQESLDSIEIDTDAEAEFFAALQETDETVEDEGEKALNSWVRERLHFISRHLDSKVLRYIHDLRRPTLVPLMTTITSFGQCIDRAPDAGHSTHALPLLPMTFERATAEKNGVSLLRVGHPFINALEMLVRSDDRGVAFAMWRRIPTSVPEPQLFFRFDFVIEADLSKANTILSEVITSLHALRRHADSAFPVQYRTVWLDADLNHVQDQNVLRLLALPFSKTPRLDGGQDINLRLERWKKVDELLSIGDWSGLCFRAREKARTLIATDASFRDKCRLYATRVRKASDVVQDALKSRLQRLSGTVRQSEERMATLESAIADVLAEGIKQPAVRADSAGAVFISGSDLGAQ